MSKTRETSIRLRWDDTTDPNNPGWLVLCRIDGRWEWMDLRQRVAALRGALDADTMAMVDAYVTQIASAPPDHDCAICDCGSGHPPTYNPATNGFDCDMCRATIVTHNDCGCSFYGIDGTVCDVCGEGE